MFKPNGGNLGESVACGRQRLSTQYDVNNYK